MLFEKKEDVKKFAFEFIDFKEQSLDVFRRVKSLITHLIFGGALTADPVFSKVIRECPRLSGVDLSRSLIRSDRLSDLPSHLEELDISHCPWLTVETLRDIFRFCPYLEKLSLGSNAQLTFSAWPELRKLTGLKALDISRSHQIGDQEIRLIVQSCPGLAELSMEDCPKMTDQSFFDLPKTLPSLYSLNIAHCTFSDSPLIEYALHCTNLTILNISNCSNITDKGIMEFIRLRPTLRSLKVTHTNSTRRGSKR